MARSNLSLGVALLAISTLVFMQKSHGQFGRDVHRLVHSGFKPTSIFVMCLSCCLTMPDSLDFICQLSMRDAIEAHIKKVVALATAPWPVRSLTSLWTYRSGNTHCASGRDVERAAT